MKQKPLKVYYNGELRDSAGKFTSFRRIVWRGCEYVLVSLFIILFVGLYWGSKQPMTYTAEAQEIQVVDRTPEKIEKLKDQVVADLAKCESGGHNEDTGIIVFDSNDRASIGQLQFQKATVIHYMKTLYGKDITGKEAVMIALDTEKASALAKDIIFKDSKGWRNWFNCETKLGLGAKVEIIKELSR